MQVSLTLSSLPAAGCWLCCTKAGSLGSRHSFCKSEMRSEKTPGDLWFVDLHLSKEDCVLLFIPFFVMLRLELGALCSVPGLHPSSPVPFYSSRPRLFLSLACAWVVEVE